MTVVARVHGQGVWDQQQCGDRPLLRLRVTQVRLSAQRIAELEADNEGLRARAVELEADNEGLRARVAELESKVAAERRAGKRQAAPFSKGEPKADPKRSGRKPGEAYGRKAHRTAPDHVGEIVAVPAPDVCPDCGGQVVSEGTACQWVEDIPPVVAHVTRYDIQVGRCAGCDRRVTGRDPGQVSDATGAAGAQIGPRAVALAGVLHHELGVPHSKTADILAQLVGCRSLRAGSCRRWPAPRADAPPPTPRSSRGSRPAGRWPPTRPAGGSTGRGCGCGTSPATGSRSTGSSTPRGWDQAKEVLGEDFAGVLEHDGWAAYRKLAKARHQSCYAHICDAAAT